MMGYTAEEKLEEVKRELRMRKQVYKTMIEDERMNPHTAAFRIGVMEAISEDYEKLAQSERLI